MPGHAATETSHDITELLIAWRAGDDQVLVRLMPLVYRELKAIAGKLMRGERRGGTLETTVLVHEAYFRLAELDRLHWKDRAHFFAMSARVMRRVLVDEARYRHRDKRGGGAMTISIDDLGDTPGRFEPEILALEEALGALKEHDPERAEIVELRFFGGLDRREIAEVMALSTATVTRRWRSARAWLGSYLAKGAA